MQACEVGLRVSVEKLAMTRKRAPTTELKCPQPEPHPSTYTATRVQEGIYYATRRLHSKTRKVSPLTEDLLKIYSGVCHEYLKVSSIISEKQRLERLNEVRKYERDLRDRSWLNAAGERLPGLEEWILKMRRLQYLLRYGDYTALVAQNLRWQAQKSKTQGWNNISGQFVWTDIADKMDKEAYDWEDISKKLQEEGKEWAEFGSKHSEKVPTRLAVYHAAHNISMSFETSVKAIDLHAKRNEVARSALAQNLERGDAAKVAHMLYEDIAELPSVVSSSNPEWKLSLTVILTGLRDSWLDTSMEHNLPGAWIVKEAFWATRRERLGKLKRKEVDTKQQKIVAEKAARIVVENEAEELALLEQVKQKPDPTLLPLPGPIPHKRKVGDTETDVSSPGKRQKVWDEAVKQQEGCHQNWWQISHSTRAALQRQRQVNLVTKSLYDFHGASRERPEDKPATEE